MKQKSNPKAVRESMSGNSKMLIGAVVALFLAAGALLFFQLRPAGSSSAPSVAKEWFTIDDGKNWFAASADNLPPFDYNGKTAYRCQVWTCDGGKTKFVSHLERMGDEAKKILQGKRDDPAKHAFDIVRVEVKAPMTGEQGWVQADSPRGQTIMTPRSPTGGGNAPEAVRPE